MKEAFARFFQKRFTVNSAGAIKKPNGHTVTVEEVFKQFRDAQEDVGNEVTITVEDAKAYVKEHTPVAEVEEEWDLEKFILNYIFRTTNTKDPAHPPEWRIDSGFRTIETIHNGIPIPSDMPQLAAAIRTYALKAGLGKSAKADDIKTVLNDLARRYGATLIANIASSISYDPSKVEEADAFLLGLRDLWQIKQSQEIVNTVMRHFLWQVKRKLLGMSVTWPIWPNFYGGSSLGKSSMINSIGAVLKDFAIMTTISELLDEERQVQKLCSTYFINIDELSIETRNPYTEDGSLTKGQNTALKKLLTQEKSRTRNMGGQTQSTRRYTFSVISSANEHLYDIIYDEKTMRRYYEFECKRDKIEDYTVLDELKKHIVALWKSVDEHNDTGYLYPGCGVWDEIQAEQNKYYPTNTNTRYWITDTRVVSCGIDERESLRDLYDNYRDYCKEHGNIPKQYRHWAKDIRHLVEGVSLKDTEDINIRCLGEEDK